MAHDVFISYSHKDQSTADAICDALEANGIRCWIATRHIQSGEEWDTAIVNAIAAPRVMVLVFSSHSNVSGQVQREIRLASDRKIRAIPFRIEDVPFSPPLEYHLSTANWLNALTPPLAGHLEHLARDLTRMFPGIGAPDGKSRVEVPSASPALRPAISARPAPTPPPTKINPADGSELIYIPPGWFIMGSDDHHEDEKPRRNVYLDGYYIAKNQVTVAQYRKFCDITRHPPPRMPEWGWDGKENYPVVNVTWDDATAYCTWAELSLPTEEEWEKAARGPNGLIYPWGNDWDPAKCRNFGNVVSSPSPVGSFPKGASPYGVLDMAGNVWEWCDNWYVKHVNRAVRGGGWGNDSVVKFRCARRDRYVPGYRNDDSGFRGVFRSG